LICGATAAVLASDASIAWFFAALVPALVATVLVQVSHRSASKRIAFRALIEELSGVSLRRSWKLEQNVAYLTHLNQLLSSAAAELASGSDHVLVERRFVETASRSLGLLRDDEVDLFVLRRAEELRGREVWKVAFTTSGLAGASWRDTPATLDEILERWIPEDLTAEHRLQVRTADFLVVAMRSVPWGRVEKLYLDHLVLLLGLLDRVGAPQAR
jgi:hypothetical protein